MFGSNRFAQYCPVKKANSWSHVKLCKTDWKQCGGPWNSKFLTHSLAFAHALIAAWNAWAVHSLSIRWHFVGILLTCCLIVEANEDDSQYLTITKDIQGPRWTSARGKYLQQTIAPLLSCLSTECQQIIFCRRWTCEQSQRVLESGLFKLPYSVCPCSLQI